MHVILDHFFRGKYQWLNNSVFECIESRNVFSNSADVIEAQPQVACSSRLLSLAVSLFSPLVVLNLLIELLFLLLKSFFALHIIDFLECLLSDVDLLLLIYLNLFQYHLVLALGCEKERLYHFSKQWEVDDFVSTAGGEAHGVIEKEFEGLVLVLEDLGCLQVALSHVGFCNVRGLIVSHQKEIEHQFVQFILLCHLPFMTFLVTLCPEWRTMVSIRRNDSFHKRCRPLKPYMMIRNKLLLHTSSLT